MGTTRSWTGSGGLFHGVPWPRLVSSRGPFLHLLQKTCRCGNSLVDDMEIFDVSIPGMDEKVVAKVGRSMDGRQQSLKRELEIYWKLKNLTLDHETRVPEFKGENYLKNPRPIRSLADASRQA